MKFENFDLQNYIHIISTKIFTNEINHWHSKFRKFIWIKKKKIKNQRNFKIVSLAKKKEFHTTIPQRIIENSELFLERCFKKIYKNDRLVVDTKLPKNLEKNNLENEIEKIVKDSIKKLQIKKINILYIHDSSQLYKKSGKKIYNQILSLKKKNLLVKLVFPCIPLKKQKKYYWISILMLYKPH